MNKLLTNLMPGSLWRDLCGKVVYLHFQEILVFPETTSFVDSMATSLASQYSASGPSWVTTPPTEVSCQQILQDERASHEVKAQDIKIKAAPSRHLRSILIYFELNINKAFFSEFIFI